MPPTSHKFHIPPIFHVMVLTTMCFIALSISTRQNEKGWKSNSNIWLMFRLPTCEETRKPGFIITCGNHGYVELRNTITQLT